MTQQTSMGMMQEVAQQLGMNQQDLVQQSLMYYLEGKLRELNAELSILKSKYNIQSIEAFDELNETGVIEESESWQDYQQFDNLTFKNQSVARTFE